MREAEMQRGAFDSGPSAGAAAGPSVKMTKNKPVHRLSPTSIPCALFGTAE